ncbi:hypothetical protein SKTS_24740 [Sulfurimicrobium lacus]|uniref:Response regulatory domain-containing protein n=1 Tax=Sulfurimicrobium lacus TaxID=2715678 RepID=A0A6F8VCZ0_9PROT|nr:hypothetical protein [Sulfurimicrobium lacus]BCB27588.1 hypothetical protein SKTS_24740 [Sulfurimicrobium lacus]
MRILIAEKDPNGRRLLEQMMRMEGYDVFVAQGCKQAKSLISEVNPDIILMNVFSPLQSGNEPLEQVKVYCNEGMESAIYVTCIGQCNELNADEASESSHSLFDHLPTRLKINIVERIQRLCIALKQLKRWLVSQTGFSLERTFALEELESYALARIMRCS